MAPGGSENARFDRFRGLVANWAQEALRMLVLNVFLASWALNLKLMVKRRLFRAFAPL